MANKVSKFEVTQTTDTTSQPGVTFQKSTIAGTLDDIITVTSVDKSVYWVQIDGGAGNNTILGATDVSNSISVSGNGSNELTGGRMNDIISGADGNDVISTGEGDNYAYGGGGNDLIVGGTGNDILDGGGEDDTLIGGGGNDTLIGGWGKDTFTYLVDPASRSSVDFGAQWGNDVINDFTTGEDKVDIRDLFMRMSDADEKKILKLIDDAVTVTRPAGSLTDVYALQNQAPVGNANKPAGYTGSEFSDINTADSKNNLLYKYNGLDGKTYQVTIGTSLDLQNRVTLKMTFQTLDASGNKIGTAGSIQFNNVGDLKSTDFLLDTQKLMVGTDATETLDLSKGAKHDALGGKGAAVYGFAGDDTIIGSENNDNLNGGDGNDTLAGGAGNDTLTGGKGSDTFVYGLDPFAIETVDLGAQWGNDIITDFKSGEDKIDLHKLFARISNGDQQGLTAAIDAAIKAGVDGNTSNVYKYAGLDGNVYEFTVATSLDANRHMSLKLTFQAYGQNGAKMGTAGSIQVNNAESVKVGDFVQNNPTVNNGTDKTEAMWGTQGDDKIFAKGGDDLVFGLAGDDIISGGAGNDTLYGSGGDDVIFGNAGSNTVYGEGGRDIFGVVGTGVTYDAKGNATYGFEAGSAIIQDFTVGEDRLLLGDLFVSYKTGSKGDAQIQQFLDSHMALDTARNRIIIYTGAVGDLNNALIINSVTGGTLADVHARMKQAANWADYFVIGKSGALYVPSNDVTLTGSDGNDTLSGGDGNDTLSGGNGDDTLNGNGGDDTLNGGDGNDTLNGGAGNDTLNGDNGNDILNGGDGNDVLNGGAGDDTLNGGAGDDTLNGGDGNDTLDGGAGNDMLNGENGNDTLNGGDGNDALNGGAGNDVLNGGTGDDTLDGGDGNDILNGGDGSDILSGSKGDDTLYGNAGDDTLNGGDGNDILEGGAGNDTLNGDNGNDTLNGGDGNDVLNGGAGDDVLTGGSGSDTLAGGAGRDVFTYALDPFVIDNVNFGALWGNDVITDFKSGEDKIDVHTLLARVGKGDQQAILNSIDTTIKAGATANSSNVCKYTGIDGNTYEITVSSTLDAGKHQTLKLTFQSYDQSGNKIGTSGSIQINNAEGVTSSDFVPNNPYRMDGSEKGENIGATGGDDVVFGHDGNDLVVGFNGDDKIIGGAGNDALYGSDGNDVIFGNTGVNTVAGEGGNDIFGVVGTGVTYDAKGNASYGFEAGSTTIQDFTVGQDRILLGDVFAGYKSGSKGDAQIQQFLDTHVVLDAVNKKIIIYTGAVGDTNNVLVLNSVTGGTLADVFAKMKQAANWADYFVTGKASSVYNGISDDRITGTDGNDTLFGGAGNDTLTGGAGNDTLTGSAGRDVFSYAVDPFVMDNADFGKLWGNDVITDFKGGEDKIDMHKFFARVSKGDQQAILNSIDTAMNTGATPTSTKVSKYVGLDGNTYEITVSSTLDASKHQTLKITVQSYDQNGNKIGTAGSIQINNAEGLKSSDFVQNNPYRIEGTDKSEFLGGTGGDDLIITKDGDDRVYGFDGDDTIIGGGGNDALYGSGGDDVIFGNTGVNNLYGEGGRDIFGVVGGGVSYDAKGNAVYVFESGNTTIQDFTVGQDRILLGDVFTAYRSSSKGDAHIQQFLDTHVVLDAVNKKIIIYTGAVGDANNVLVLNNVTGGTLADVFAKMKQAANWADYFVIGKASSVYGVSSDVTLVGTDGNDILVGGIGNDTINGGKGDDTLNGNAGDDALSGGDGNDTLDGGVGNDTLNGDNGNDTLNGGDGNDVLHGGAGDDTLSGGAGDDTLNGGDGNDALDGGAGNDTLNGDNGNDVLSGGDGNDQLNGGAGDDTLSGGAGDDTLNGDNGNDVLSGGDGNDILNGGAGDDVLYGGAGNDTLNGGDGNDTITGGAGNDTLTGGNGKDIYIYAIDPALRSGIDLGALWGNDTITDFKSGEDKLDLYNFFSRINNADQKKILGLIEDAAKAGTAGTPIKYTGLDGNVYELTIGSVPDANKHLSLTLTFQTYTTGNQKVGAAASILLQNADGLRAADIISDGPKFNYGTNGDDYIDLSNGGLHDGLGGNGGDVNGLGGDDTIIGSEYNDTIDGGAGNDTINGAAGDDTLTGGAGNDTQTGGAGKDRFVYTLDPFVMDNVDFGALWGNDIITDFKSGEDKIDFHKLFGRLMEADQKAILSGIDRVITSSAVFNVVSAQRYKGLDGNIYEISIESILDANHHKTLKLTFQSYDQNNAKIGTAGSIQINNADSVRSSDFVQHNPYRIDGTDANEWKWGSQGDDLMLGHAGEDVVFGLGGDDIVSGGAGNDALYGSGGDDVIFGNTGSNTLYGEGGRDIFGVVGTGVSYDAKGNANYSFEAGYSVVQDFTVGQDRILLGDVFASYKSGAKGDAQIQQFLDTHLVLDTPNNRIIIYTGAVGDLNNALVLNSVTGGKLADVFAKMKQAANWADYFVLGKSAGVYGLVGDDELVGTDGHDKLVAGAGNDTLIGGGGNDTLTGGAGKDVFAYQLDTRLRDGADLGAKWGNDVITDFKPGEDKLDLRDFFARISEADQKKVLAAFDDACKSGGSAGTPVKYTGVDGNLYEVTIGSTLDASKHLSLTLTFQTYNANNQKIGTSASIRIDNADGIKSTDVLADGQKFGYGTNGNDILDFSKGALHDGLGGKGAIVNGLAGDDIIIGSEFNDSMDGGDGNDTLSGQAGNDTLTGGKDKDTFTYALKWDAVDLGAQWGSDVITDFKPGEDKLDLREFFIRISDADQKKILGLIEKAGQIPTLSAISKYTGLDGNTYEVTVSSALDAGKHLSLSLTFQTYSASNQKIGTAASIRIDNADGITASDVLLDTRKIISGTANGEMLDLRTGSLMRSIGDKGAIIYALAGDDVVVASGKNDMIFGGDGNDTLFGLPGNDTMSGNSGKDTFAYLLDWNSKPVDFGAQWGNDIITDFKAGEDKIAIDALFVRISQADQQKFLSSINTASTGGATADTSSVTKYTGNDGNSYEVTVSTTLNADKTMTMKLTFQGYDPAGNKYGTASTIEIDNANGIKATDFLTINYTLVQGTDKGDTLRGYAGTSIINGLGGDDGITGTGDADYISGGDGNDVIEGLGGADMLSGGNGSDIFAYTQSEIDDPGKKPFYYTSFWGNDTITDFEAGKDKIDIRHFFSRISEPDEKRVLSAIDEAMKAGAAGYVKIIQCKNSAGNQCDVTIQTVVDAQNRITLNMAFLGYDVDGKPYAYPDSIAMQNANGLTSADFLTDTQKRFTTTNGADDLDYRKGWVPDYLGGKGVIVHTLGGHDKVVGSVTDDAIYGGDGNDTIYGDTGNDVLYGEAGVDNLDGGAGNDTLYGGGDGDIFYGADGNDILNGDAGDDRLNGGNGNGTLYGGDGNDLLYADQGDDVLYGGAGNDRLDGYDGNDTLDGEDGDDELFGLNGNDMLSGGTGKDRLNGGNGNDTLHGGDGNDLLYGDLGDDVLYGGAGNDRLDGYDGNDTLDGGDGDDELFGLNGNDTLNGGAGNDRLTGDDGKDVMHGDAGNDTMDGGSDDDTMYGDAGDDTMYSGSGNNTLNGGDGKDSIMGNNGDDVIHGDAGNDSMWGDYGNDTLYGDAGDDILYGGYGNDVMNGGAGNDTLYGGFGDDTLQGGGGDDVLRGGENRDIFKVAGTGVTLDAKGKPVYGFEGGKTFIDDFTVGEDKIKLGDVFAKFGHGTGGDADISTFLNEHIVVDAVNKNIIIYTGAVGDTSNELVVHVANADPTDVFNKMHQSAHWADYFVMG